MKRKRKVSFDLYNFFEPCSEEVSKIQGLIKGFTAVAAGSTYFASNIDYAGMVAIFGFVLDALAACLCFEDDNDAR